MYDGILFRAPVIDVNKIGHEYKNDAVACYYDYADYYNYYYYSNTLTALLRFLRGTASGPDQNQRQEKKRPHDVRDEPEASVCVCV